MCNTAYFFALSRHTDKLPHLEPRIQNLQDSKSPGLKTEGFKHSRIHALRDSRIHGWKDSMIQVRATSPDFFNSAFGFPKTRLTKTIVPKGWSSNIKLEKSKT